MNKTLPYCAALMSFAISAAIGPARAQFAPSPPTSAAPQESPPPASTSPAVNSPKKKTAQPAGPGISGTWSGELNQVGSTTPYKFELSITPKGAETKYPDLDCVGKLTRVGQSKSYIFFIEIITKGQADKGGRCPDGTITVGRQGDHLALSWFGSVQGNIIAATGVLSKR
jgi:hypothetical protein